MSIQISGGGSGAPPSSLGGVRLDLNSVPPGAPPINVPVGKRRVCGPGPEAEEECVQVLPLGAGCEVGRSCVVASFRGFKVMFDCGVHPAHSGIGALPLFDGEEMGQVDICLVTHFHLDHCGALPYLLTKTAFKGRVFMTQPTRLISRLLWQDYARMGKFGEGEGGVALFSEEDIDYTMQVVETLDFRQQITVGPAKISCFGAGHVVGACMFLVEIGGVRILYTGDFSREQDRHVPVAEVPNTEVHVLISESTYGVHVHEARPLRERRLLRAISDAIARGGKVLLPVFALGRAQELLLILDDHWRSHPALHRVPIFFVSPLSAKSMAVFEAFVDMCGEELRNRALQGENPFHLRHVRVVRSMDQIAAHIHGASPCVLLAAPGMLQSGPSREAFEAWAGVRRNLVILTGYTVRGTLADEIRKDQEVLQLPDRQLRRRCVVEVISFSAHSDYNQTRDFIARLRVPNVVLVHGERTEMKRLQEKLLYENPALSVFTPEILQTVALQFKANRCAVALGDAAARLHQLLPHKTSAARQLKEEPEQNEEGSKSIPEQQHHVGVPGCAEDDWDSLLLLQQGQQPLLVAAAETEALTGVACATLEQRVRAPFPRPMKTLWQAAADIFDEIEPLKCTCHDNTREATANAKGSAESCSDCCAFLVAGCVAVHRVEETGSPPFPVEEKKVLTDAASADAAATDEAKQGDAVPRAAGQRTWIEVSWEASPTADLVADSLLFLSCDLLRPTIEDSSGDSEKQRDVQGEEGADEAPPFSKSTHTDGTGDEGELILLQILQQHLTEHFGPVRLCRRRKGARSANSSGSSAPAPASAESDGYEEIALAEAAVAPNATSDVCLVFHTTAEQTAATAAADAQGVAAKSATGATAEAAVGEASASQGAAAAKDGQRDKENREALSPSIRQEGEVVEVCVDFGERQVHCSDVAVQQRVRTLVARVEKSLLPLELPS